MTKQVGIAFFLLCLFGALLQITACGSSSTHNGGGGGGTAPLSVTTSSLSSGTVGTAYTASLQASGGTPPYSWAVKSGTLPAGLSLSAAGAISGTPTTVGTASSLVFEVTDASKSVADSGSLSIVVDPSALVVTTKSLPSDMAGTAYAANLQASGGTPPYAWALKSGTLPAGLSLSGAGAITGTPTTPGTFGSLVFQVTDANKVTAASAALSIQITPLPLVVTTSSLPSDDAQTAYPNFSLQATGGTAPYTWSVQSGTLPAGLTLGATTGVISGTPTTPGISSLVFQVTDASSVTAASGTLSLQIYDVNGCSAGNESALGTQPYAFLIKAFDGFNAGVNDPVTIAGSFTPDGKGNITAGEEDINNNTGHTNPTITSGSTYALGADNRGCLTLVTASSTIKFRYALGGFNGSAFTTGRIIEFDDNSGTGTRGSGILRLQDPTAFNANLSGMYAFLFTGTDVGGGHFGVAGSFSASSLAITNLAVDYDDAGTVNEVSGGSGTYTATVNGRGTASLAASPYNVNAAYYIVNSNEVIFASIDPIATNPITSGEALLTTGPFSASDLKGSTYAAHAIGLATGDVPVATISTAVFDGVSSVTGVVTQNRGGTVSGGPMQATYSVNSTTGRVLFTGNFVTPVGYLVKNNPVAVSAFLVGGDFPATSGVLDPPASGGQLTGPYFLGTEEDADYATLNEVGTLNLAGGTFSGTEDLSGPATPFLTLDQSIPSTAFTFATDGTGTFGQNTDAVTNGSVVYYILEKNADGTPVTHPRITAVVK